MVGQDHITSGIELYQDVKGVLSFAELYVNHTINAQLLNLLQLLGSHMLSEFHSKARGDILFIAKELSGMQTDSCFNEEMFLPVRL
jgi:hypothetical protein